MITLRCSGAAGWTRCGFKPHLESLPGALPDEEGDAAKEGTAAAWVAECVVNGDAYTAEDLVGRVHRNGVEIDPDMARFIQPYIERIQTFGGSAEIYGELPAPDGSFKIAGTSDAQYWTTPEDYHVDDLKYGFGIVEPTTEQLLAYALIAHYVYGITPRRWHLSIFQPRAMHPLGPYRTRTITHDEFLIEAGMLWTAAIKTVNPVAATPGEHCDHCRAAAICTALTHSVYSMWQPINDRTYIEPTPQQLADELEMLDRMSELLKARKEAVEAETLVRLNGGQVIPGWAKMPTQGKRKFKYPADVIQAMTGIDPRITEICTPAELERRGANKSVLSALTTRPTVGYKLERYDSNKIGAMFK